MDAVGNVRNLLVIVGNDSHNDFAKIGANAFGASSSLKEIYISNISNWCASVLASEIGNGQSLYVQEILCKELNIPDGVKKIGQYTFSNCSKIEFVNLPSSIREIGDNAFSGCSALHHVNFPTGISYVGANAFAYCTKLSGDVHVPGGVKALGDYAFLNCESVTNVHIEEGVGSIGKWAFFGCRRIVNIRIPSTVQTIGEHAFYVDTYSYGGIKRNVYLADLARWCEVRLDDQYASPTWLGVNEVFINNSPIPECLNVPPEVGRLANYVFLGFGRRVDTLYIPDSVTNIEEHALYGLSNLSCLRIPPCVEVMKDSFPDVYETVSNVCLSPKVDKLADDAFADCCNLRGIGPLEQVRSIGSRAFMRCSGLSSFVIPANVEDVGDGVFKECDHLLDVEICASLTKIPDNAFC